MADRSGGDHRCRGRRRLPAARRAVRRRRTRLPRWCGLAESATVGAGATALDATCGKGSPAPAAPSPGVALVAWWPGLVAVAAAAASIRRRHGHACRAPGRRPRPPVPPAAVLLARPAPRPPPFARTRAWRTDEQQSAGRADRRPPDLEPSERARSAATARTTPIRSKENTTMSKSATEIQGEHQQRNAGTNTTKSPDRARSAGAATAGPERAFRHAPPGPDGPGPGRARRGRHRHHGRRSRPPGLQPGRLDGVLAPRHRRVVDRRPIPGRPRRCRRPGRSPPSRSRPRRSNAVGSPASVVLPSRVGDGTGTILPRTRRASR